MSYILDALNKADHERERQRSAIPTLHAQVDLGRPGAGSALWRWVALGTIAVLAAVLAWLWLAPAAPAGPAPLSALPLPLSSPPVAPETVAAAPATAVTVAPAPMPAAPPAAVEKPAPAVAAGTPVPARPAAASAPARLPTRNELPPELRAALPPINISGAVYAPAASGRMLFANGLVLREGDALAEGLTVERIGASASVLVFRGQRFQISH